MPDNIDDILRDLIPKDIDSLLDVGCGSRAKALGITDAPTIVGIDVDPRGVEGSRRFGMATELMDMREIGNHYVRNSFDVVLFRDSLEHVSKAESDVVVETAKGIAARMILAFVPIGATGDNPKDEGPHKHKHHWQPAELEALGFEVTVYAGYHRGASPGDAMLGVWRKEA